MAKVIINPEKCKGCLLCVSFCPQGLIKKSKKLNLRSLNYVEFTASGECLGCLQCTLICPECCIQILE